MTDELGLPLKPQVPILEDQHIALADGHRAQAGAGDGAELAGAGEGAAEPIEAVIGPIAGEVDHVFVQAAAQDGAGSAWMVLMNQGQITGRSNSTIAGSELQGSGAAKDSRGGAQIDATFMRMVVEKVVGGIHPGLAAKAACVSRCA